MCVTVNFNVNVYVNVHMKLCVLVHLYICTRCIQNQIEILKYPSSAATERLSVKIIFKDGSKME
jgi:hypothetical protein